MGPSQTTLDKVSKFIKEVGFPIAVTCGLFFVGISYWVVPQSKQAEKLIDVLTKHLDISEIRLTKIEDVIDKAYTLMEDVPELRVKEIETQVAIQESLKELSKSSSAEHEAIVSKLSGGS